MAGFELGFSGVRSNRSVNCNTTIALLPNDDILGSVVSSLVGIRSFVWVR